MTAPHQQRRLYMAVGCGAAVGALARYLVGFGVASGQVLPALSGTAAVNVAGSFMIVFFAIVTGPDGRWPAGPALRQFVMTGFCGGLTTFSAMSLETFVLAAEGRLTMAATYLGLSVLASLVAAWGGHASALRLNR